MAVSDHFAIVDGRKVFYRRSGEGPTVVFLHGSPQSSRAVQPLVEAVGEGFTCIAMDTPGNGLSDPLPLAEPNAADYADALAGFLDALNLKRVALYGFHTGAGTAMEFLRRHPGRATCLVADGYAVWTDDERADFLANYLPPFEIRPDGSHLASLWSRMEEQTVFFPWYRRTDEGRMVYDVPPPAHIHANAMDVLQSGDHFRAPYASAFRRRGQDGLHEIQDAKVLIACAANDPLVTHLDRLPPDLPDNFAIERKDADRSAVLARFRRHLQAYPADFARAAPAPQADAAGLAYGASPPSAGGLHWSGRLDGRGRPLVLLHDAAGAKRLFSAPLPEIVKHRPGITLDLPGYGDNAHNTPDTVEGFADIIERALDAIGLSEIDACGFQLGGQIAVELAARGRARTAGMIGACVWDDAERVDLLERYAAPSLSPVWDGAHLTRAWKIALWSGLFYPWYQRDASHMKPSPITVNPLVLHHRATDLLKAGDNYKSGVKAQHSYDLTTALSKTDRIIALAAPFDALSSPDRFARIGLTPQPLSADIQAWANPLADL